jgi:opacity protein-like surface antigen
MNLRSVLTGTALLAAAGAALYGCQSMPDSGEQAAMTRAPASAAPTAQSQGQQARTPAPPPTKEPVGTPASGPYVGVQVGYSRARDANFREDNSADPNCFLFVTGVSCGGTLNHLGSSPVVGVSVGYRINPMFRLDLGYQRRSGFNLSGSDPAGTDFDPKVSSDSFMVSGFVDLPYRFDLAGGAQPYAGLAVGRSKNSMDSLNWNDRTCCSGTLNSGTSHTSTTWQFTLGAALTISGAWVLDIAYRYSDLGEFKKSSGPDQIGNFTGFGTTTSATGKLRANEILLGIRYSKF